MFEMVSLTMDLPCTFRKGKERWFGITFTSMQEHAIMCQFQK
jgi:hypothetical protein